MREPGDFGDGGSTLSPEGCDELLDSFLDPPEVLLAALAPEGWERSPLRRVFHPTPEQVEAKTRRIRRNLRSLGGGGSRRRTAETTGEASGEGAGTPEPLEATGLEAERPDGGLADGPPGSDRPDPWREVVELVGSALWDVFSANHSVVDREGRVCDLGSFRGAAGRIADAIDRRYPELDRTYGYLDFYMGTALVSGRADLRPVYRWIFDRLRGQGWDWHYSFPRQVYGRLPEGWPHPDM